MQYIWNITLEDYEEIIELAKEHGKKPGDSMEEELIEIMTKKRKKPSGITELTKEELIKEYTSQGKKVAYIKIDDKGQTILKDNKEELEKNKLLKNWMDEKNEN